MSLVPKSTFSTSLAACNLFLLKAVQDQSNDYFGESFQSYSRCERATEVNNGVVLGKNILY